MYNQTRVTTPTRHADRASYDTEVVHQILDEALICHVGFVDDASPQVLPMLFVRLGSTVFLHSSTGARMAKLAAHQDGIEIALEATVLDALVLARSAFNHSANYRSVIVHGKAELVRDAQARAEILEGLMEKLVPGRSESVRGPTEIELRKTAVLALPLVQVSAKVRSGPPVDEPEDLLLGYWAGLWPVRVVHGEPQAAPDLSPGIELPEHLRALTQPRPAGTVPGDA
jgi:nitroimidazol reductase NimA-like FMN-containing flavoprotein (pyridoxamine 5'-phosphate oxidase superfamily)